MVYLCGKVVQDAGQKHGVDLLFIILFVIIFCNKTPKQILHKNQCLQICISKTSIIFLIEDLGTFVQLNNKCLEHNVLYSSKFAI